MRRCVLLSFVILTVGFAPAPFPRAEKRAKPSNEAIGLWSGGSEIEITHDRLTYHPTSPNKCAYELKVNLAVRPITYELRGVAGTSTAGRNYHGIYKVEGDTLTLRYNGAGSPRPTGFDVLSGGISEVYKRVQR